MKATPPLCAGDLAELDSESRQTIKAGHTMVEQGRATPQELLGLHSYRLAVGVQRLLAERSNPKAPREQDENPPWAFETGWSIGVVAGLVVISASVLIAPTQEAKIVAAVGLGVAAFTAFAAWLERQLHP